MCNCLGPQSPEASSQKGKKLKLNKTRSLRVNLALTASLRQQDLILGKEEQRLHFHTQPQRRQVPLSQHCFPFFSSLVLLINLHFNQVYVTT